MFMATFFWLGIAVVGALMILFHKHIHGPYQAAIYILGFFLITTAGYLRKKWKKEREGKSGHGVNT